MKRRRFLKLAGAVGVVLAGVGAVVVKLLNGSDVEVLSESAIQISGNFGGTIPVGTTGHIVGDVNLTADLIVEGTLTGVDTFTVTGNGFQLLVQNGGVVNLAGKPKSGWVRWGETVSGWVTGDRLAVAPTAVGVFVPTVVIWQGSWAATSRPANAADVTLVDGLVAKPEVANLTRSITMSGLRRFHLHDGAGVQSLKHFAIVNSGTVGVLGDYPLHFHLCGDTVRGSTIEGVVVEGGKNHAFVPHGSHGITFPDCVAYNTTGVAFWWDKPEGNSLNDSVDIDWSDTLAMWVKSSTLPGESARVAGYWLGAGANNKCHRSVATCVTGQYPKSGSMQRSGFHWPENAASVWDFVGNLDHNNAENGIFTWQNSTDPPLLHFIEDHTSYHHGYASINHGAYQNVYRYTRLVLTGGLYSIIQHAKSRNGVPHTLTFEDLEVDRPVLVTKHQSQSPALTIFRRGHLAGVIYVEPSAGSYNLFEDLGLTPADFDLNLIAADSIIEIREAGILTHQWKSGRWTTY